MAGARLQVVEPVARTAGFHPGSGALCASEEGLPHQEGDRRPFTLGGQIGGRREPEDANEHVVRPALC